MLTIPLHLSLLVFMFLTVGIVLPRFFYIVGNKILKTTEIFDKIEHLKNLGVTYRAESIGPLVNHIIG